MKYLWFGAFAIWGIAFWLWWEEFSRAHREAFERLLAEVKRTRAEQEAEEALERAWAGK